jgi:hypothetical protein
MSEVALRVSRCGWVVGESADNGAETSQAHGKKGDAHA